MFGKLALSAFWTKLHSFFFFSPPPVPLCPNMFFPFLSNNMWRIFQLFIKQCQSFLGAGDAVNYSTITWVIMQRRREKSSSTGMKRTLAEVDRLRWQCLGPRMASD